VDLSPLCATAAATCASPPAVAVTLSPVKEHGSCQSLGTENSFVFGKDFGGQGAAVPVRDGSFAVTHVFPGGIKIAVSGTFTSTSHVQGTISGLRVCGSDTYSISLPITAMPCTLLAKAGTAAALSLGNQVQPANGGDLYPSGGECSQHFGTNSKGDEVTFSVSSSFSNFEAMLGAPPTGTPVRGLGRGAVFEFSSRYGYQPTMTVIFHRSATWAYLQFEVLNEQDQYSCYAAKPCPYPAPGREVVEARLLGIAQQLYPSLV